MVDDRRRFHDEDADPDAISVWDLPLAPSNPVRVSPPATEIAAAAPVPDLDTATTTYREALAASEEWFEADEQATPATPRPGMFSAQPEPSDLTRFSRALGGAPSSPSEEPGSTSESEAAAASASRGLASGPEIAQPLAPPVSVASAAPPAVPAEAGPPAAPPQAAPRRPGSQQIPRKLILLGVTLGVALAVAIGLLLTTSGVPAGGGGSPALRRLLAYMAAATTLFGDGAGRTLLAWLVAVAVAGALVGGAVTAALLLRRPSRPPAPTSQMPTSPSPQPVAPRPAPALPAPTPEPLPPPSRPPSPWPVSRLPDIGAPPAPAAPRPQDPTPTPSPYDRFVPPRSTEADAGTDWAEGDTIVGRYRVARRIVSGMGVVYLCHDAVQRVPVAIKTYRDLDGQAHTPDGRQRDVLLARLFEAEALIWTRLGSHPNIVEAQYVVELQGKPHIFLEMVSGPDGRERTLRQVVKAGPQPPDRTIRLGLHVCAGMEHATTVFPGLVHRDLKPENLLLADGDIVKVTDFGLTRVFADVSGRVAALAGTPAYMSPEQCLGLTSLDTRADIYSLGVILYELLTGRRPFTRDFLQAHLTETPADPRDAYPEAPATLVTAVLRCLAKRPEERFQTFGELRAALDACHLEVTGERAILPTATHQPRTEREQAGVDLARAISLATLGRYDEAVELLNRAVLFDPGYAEAWRWRGIGLTALGQLAEAADCFDRALALAPGDVDSWLEKGRLAARLGRREDALNCFDSALRVNQDHVSARYERGAALFFLGRYAEAQADLAWANQRQPGPALQAAVEAASRRGGATGEDGGGSALDGLPAEISEAPVSRSATEERA